jgi:hypothetical protein
MGSVGTERKGGEVTQLRGLRISKRWIIEKVNAIGRAMQGVNANTRRRTQTQDTSAVSTYLSLSDYVDDGNTYTKNRTRRYSAEEKQEMRAKGATEGRIAHPIVCFYNVKYMGLYSTRLGPCSSLPCALDLLQPFLTRAFRPLCS